MGDRVTGPDRTEESAFVERLAAYRRLRGLIERNILPFATSVDGVAFEFQASLHDLSLRRGGYVTLEGDGGVRLGRSPT